MPGRIVIRGVLNADAACRAARLPKTGEDDARAGPRARGPNEAVAASCAGGQVHFILRPGREAFTDMARATWAKVGVIAETTEAPRTTWVLR